mgnify:FL=1
MDVLAERIRSAARRIAEAFLHEEPQVAGELQRELDRRSVDGVCPSIIHLAGLRDLERPLNRVLAWWADPEAEHGMAGEFLGRLAGSCEHTLLADDLARGETAEVVAEWGDEDLLPGKQPDLMVRTSRAALLIENKVRAGESGDQYGPYRRLLDLWAGARVSRAYLFSRDPRETPPGWDGVLLHRDLSLLFLDLARGVAGTRWGRIAATLSAVGFQAVPHSDLTRRGTQLLHSVGSADVPRRVVEMKAVVSSLQQLLSVPSLKQMMR